MIPLPPIARDLRRDQVGARPRAALATARHVATLTRTLRRLRPDLVHANSLKSSLYGGMAAGRPACHSWYTSVTAWPPTISRLLPFGWLRERSVTLPPG